METFNNQWKKVLRKPSCVYRRKGGGGLRKRKRDAKSRRGSLKNESRKGANLFYKVYGGTCESES